MQAGRIFLFSRLPLRRRCPRGSPASRRHMAWVYKTVLKFERVHFHPPCDPSDPRETLETAQKRMTTNCGYIDFRGNLSCKNTLKIQSADDTFSTIMLLLTRRWLRPPRRHMFPSRRPPRLHRKKDYVLENITITLLASDRNESYAVSSVSSLCYPQRRRAVVFYD